MAQRRTALRGGRSATSQLLTVLGEFTLPQGGQVWTATIVEALALLGIGESNARQAATRLGDDGIIASTRVGRSTRWLLTAPGTRLLSSGAERIYRFGVDPEPWDGQWVVALTQIPEEQREKRHAVRSQLGFAGFGTLSAGVSLSPHVERMAEAERTLSALALDPAPVVFCARVGTLGSNRDLIDRAWDLPSLGTAYDDFITSFVRRRPKNDGACFVALVDLVHEWRQFPFRDPEIPAELLPARWSGRKAKALFDDRRAAWSAPAQRWYESVEAASSSLRPPTSSQ